mgnify:CR=1 FL=1
MRKKVLVAQFVTESNANIPYKTDLENYDLRFGEDAISQMHMGTVFADAGIEVVPSVYANGFSGGVVTRNAFDYIENRLLNAPTSAPWTACSCTCTVPARWRASVPVTTIS